MLKLCNFSNYPDQLTMFQPAGIDSFLTEHGLDGVELLFGQEWSAEQLPRERIKGVHLPFYGSWLDFWLHDKLVLAQEFGTLKKAYEYYGGIQPECLVDTYCRAVQQAIKIGAQYVVFHVSQVRQQEVFSYHFKFTDEQVIRASAELLNAVFKRLDTNICLLLENLWWPGLTLCDKNMAQVLLSSVQYTNKGFMLDTGHLMNTCQKLDSQQAGIEYILSTLDRLDDMAAYIRGVHLHCSLSGNYVRRVICDRKKLDMNETLQHVFRIDEHKPFSHRDVRRILDYVRPDYLVHEFMYSSQQQLAEYLNIQNRALESGYRQ